MNPQLNFSLTQLHYAWAVFKHGHFGKAAAACHITQPTLSMQVQKLEDELGVIIFDRSKKPVLLTEAGKVIIDQIQTILMEANKIEQLIAATTSDTLQGQLTVGVIPTIAPYLLPRLLPALSVRLPNLRLKISELQTQQIIEALNNDEVDVGILATPLKIHKIHEYPLYYEPFSVLCQKGHPLARQKKIKTANLTLDDIWLLEEGHCLRNQVLDVCTLHQDKSPRRQFEFASGNLETLKQLVNTYGGYTLLPHLAIHNLGRDTALIAFERPIPSREIGLVYQRSQYKISLIEALGEAITDCLPDEIRKIRPKDLDVLDIN